MGLIEVEKSRDAIFWKRNANLPELIINPWYCKVKNLVAQSLKNLVFTCRNMVEDTYCTMYMEVDLNLGAQSFEEIVCPWQNIVEDTYLLEMKNLMTQSFEDIILTWLNMVEDFTWHSLSEIKF